jgi:hypothetical protein
MSNAQALYDAMEAAGIPNMGELPKVTESSHNGVTTVTLHEAGFFPMMPQHIQELIKDFLQHFFGERLQSMYLQPCEGDPVHPKDQCVLCLDLAA